MSERTRILLVRHGETEDNKKGVFQGQEGSELNDRGREQAGRLAARLARTPVAAIVSSDLVRARETAGIVGAAVDRPVTTDEDLREIFLGAWQGLTIAQISQRFPDEWAAWRAGDPAVRRGGGETYGELAARMVRAMRRVAEAHKGETVVVVSHGAAIKTFGGEVLGMTPGGPLWLRALRVPNNTGLAVVERDADGAFCVLVWNDGSHLGDALV
jgi:probable phosphoglycerate mutase